MAVNHAARMISEDEAVEMTLTAMRYAPVGTFRTTTSSFSGRALPGPVVIDFFEAYAHCDTSIILLDMHANLTGDNYDAAIRVGLIVYESLARGPAGSALCPASPREAT